MKKIAKKNSPDFTKNAFYEFELYSNSKKVRSGKINIKAWNKIIDQGHLWEYIPENGRVIERTFDGHRIDTGKISIAGSTIKLDLVKVPDKSPPGKGAGTGRVLEDLERIIKNRKKEMPPNSYTTSLFEKGNEKILKKIGEEAVELIISAGDRDEVVYETADLLYHIMVLFVNKGISFDKVLNELHRRMDK